MTQEQAQAFVEVQGRKAEVELMINALMNRKADLISVERQIMQPQSPLSPARKQLPTYQVEEETEEEPQPEVKKKPDRTANLSY